MRTITPVNEPSLNQRIGANIARLRKFRGMSQSDLAFRLAEVGLPFQQPTVLKVEKGTRPLKLEEGIHVAEVLGVQVSDLYTRSQTESRLAELMLDQLRTGNELRVKTEQLETLTSEVNDMKDRLVQMTDEYNALVETESPGTMESLRESLTADVAAIRDRKAESSDA